MTDHRSVSAFLAALAARFPDLETIRSDEPQAALDGENVREPAQEPGIVLRPHPGPQTRFLASSSFIGGGPVPAADVGDLAVRITPRYLEVWVRVAPGTCRRTSLIRRGTGADRLLRALDPLVA